MLRNRVSIAHAKCKKILILNLKGGVGKSTFTVNLASKLCLSHQSIELIDSDKQISSHSWASEIEQIHSQPINLSYRSYSDVASSVKVDRDCQFVIIDSPANFDDCNIKKYLMLADYVVVPLQPSPVDLHASLPFIEKIIVNLALIKKRVKVGFVVNRCTLGNPQVGKVLKLLSHFKQYKTLGLMSDSYLYQTPFISKEIENISLDEKLWGNVFHWLQLAAIDSKVTHFPPRAPSHASTKPKPPKVVPSTKRSIVRRWNYRS